MPHFCVMTGSLFILVLSILNSNFDMLAYDIIVTVCSILMSLMGSILINLPKVKVNDWSIGKMLDWRYGAIEENRDAYHIFTLFLGFVVIE